jgi:uncharacterized protein YsxB (DUF464 family)
LRMIYCHHATVASSLMTRSRGFAQDKITVCAAVSAAAHTIVAVLKSMKPSVYDAAAGARDLLVAVVGLDVSLGRIALLALVA